VQSKRKMMREDLVKEFQAVEKEFPEAQRHESKQGAACSFLHQQDTQFR